MKKYIYLLLLVLLTVSMTEDQNKRPVLYIIGDSTVKNDKGDGADGLWGWGDMISSHFDTAKIKIENHAIGGRSSRTFQEDGIWDKILKVIKPGDFVIMQFGHNDGSDLNKGRARGTLKGSGDDSVKVTMEADSSEKIIHTFGWYMKKYIREAKEKGAIPIALSCVPRNQWLNDSVKTDPYTQWVMEAAGAEKAYYIDLNGIIIEHYQTMGPEVVKLLFFLKDHTHTTYAGAQLNAYSVVKGLKKLNECELNNYLKN